MCVDVSLATICIESIAAAVKSVNLAGSKCYGVISAVECAGEFGVCTVVTRKPCQARAGKIEICTERERARKKRRTFIIVFLP